MSENQAAIAGRVVEAILAQRLKPGERLGEQEMADLFGVSRTLVREALMQLQARGFVEVRTRRGWYVVEPPAEAAHDAFAARRAVETGMLRRLDGRPLQSAIRRLRRHIDEERGAIGDGDAAARAFALADFHVCLAECLGHRVLADLLRDLTARTTLAACLYQSTHDARESCEEHARIVAALEEGDARRAEALMLDHLGSVEAALQPAEAARRHGAGGLRATLAPLERPAGTADFG